MRITRDNIQEFIATAEELKDALDSAIEAAEMWQNELDGDDAESRKEAREELDSSMESLDVSTLCQIVHGKHKGVKSA